MYAIIGTSDVDGESTLRIYADTVTHCVFVDNDTTGSDFGYFPVSRDENSITCISAEHENENGKYVSIYVNEETRGIYVSS